MKLLILFLLAAGMLVSNPSPNIKTPPNSAIKQAAFGVLTKKCNVCHTTKNPRKVFTLNNMNKYARKINRQVFVWKRMPKGNKIKLTKTDREKLRQWINAQ